MRFICFYFLNVYTRNTPKKKTKLISYFSVEFATALFHEVDLSSSPLIVPLFLAQNLFCYFSCLRKFPFLNGDFMLEMTRFFIPVLRERLTFNFVQNKQNLLL